MPWNVADIGFINIQCWSDRDDGGWRSQKKAFKYAPEVFDGSHSQSVHDRVFPSCLYYLNQTERCKWLTVYFEVKWDALDSFQEFNHVEFLWRFSFLTLASEKFMISL